MEPITLNVSGKIETVDGKHPPALNEVVVNTDKNGTIDVRGASTCKAGQLEATTTTIAEKACKPAIVGLGTTDIEVEFPQQAPIPIESKLIPFNGGTKGGTTTIFIHAFLTRPITAAVVTDHGQSQQGQERPLRDPLHRQHPKNREWRRRRDRFQPHVRKEALHLQGQKARLSAAKCSDGHFDAEAEAVFADGTKLGGKIVRACTPKGIGGDG
jgi:hypothetical protein